MKNKTIIKIGETASDAQLLVDGENILPKLGVTGLTVSVHGGRTPQVLLRFKLAGVLIEGMGDQLAARLREAADKIQAAEAGAES